MSKSGARRARVVGVVGSVVLGIRRDVGRTMAASPHFSASTYRPVIVSATPW